MSSGNDDDERHLPVLWSLVAGAVSGCIELSLLYPLDVVKTRFQLSEMRDGHHVSVGRALTRMVQREGVGTLYRGILPPMAVETPKVAIKFVANQTYDRILRARGWTGGTAASETVRAMATGALAGMTEGLVVSPFELVKVRLQDATSRTRYRNTIDCVAKVLRHEGPLALLEGAESALWRNGVWNGVFFGMAALAQHIAPLPDAATTVQRGAHSFLVGLAGGTVATMFNTPFDVVKTRIQNQGAAPRPHTMILSRWSVPALVGLASSEGIGALWKGFVPKVLRLGLGGGIMYFVYDGVLSVVTRF